VSSAIEDDDQEAAAGPDESGDGLSCPDCDEGPFPSKLSLGAHRFHKHGIRGSSQTAKKERGRKGRSQTRPRTQAAAGSDDRESGRQARRRKAVKETLVELVSFTDEARGRGEGPPDDLADVIRRDADKIANSVAWIAERFLPLGRLIDLAFGHGGLLTVARGFMGVGTWTLAHWRQLIQERQADAQAHADLVAAGLTAEEIAASMERQYLS
jgi:hypothetical protein